MSLSRSGVQENRLALGALGPYMGKPSYAPRGYILPLHLLYKNITTA